MELRHPHDKLLATGKKTAILTNADLPIGEPISVDGVGVVVLGDPARMLASEADRKEWFERHRVRQQEREAWWPGETRFKVYPVEQFQAEMEDWRAEKAEFRDYTYNGVSVRATGRRPSSRDDKKYERTVMVNGKERLVHYGDPNLPMRRDEPDRRENFLARHNCSEKKDPTAPGFWACMDWQRTDEKEADEMPYEKFKDGDKVCVRKADTGKVMHCYEGAGADGKADKYLAALRINAEAGEKGVDPAWFEETEEPAVEDEKAGNIEGLTKHLVKKLGPDPQFFSKCMADEELKDYPEENRAGICARAHKIATGIWPGEHGSEKKEEDGEKSPTKRDEAEVVVKELFQEEELRAAYRERWGDADPAQVLAEILREQESEMEEQEIEQEKEAEPEPGEQQPEPEPEGEKAGRRLKKPMVKRLRDAWETLKEMLSWAEYEEETEQSSMGGIFGDMKSEMSFAVKKARDGSDWIWTRTTNAFIDRDKEFFSTKGLERYVLEAEERDERGQYNLWHVKGTEFADVKVQAVIGRSLVEGGPFHDTPRGRAVKAFFEKYPDGHPEHAPDGWGCSPEFRYLQKEKETGVFEHFWITDRAILPRWAAANVQTKGGSIMTLITEKNGAMLKEVLGEEDFQRLVEIEEKETKELEEQGLAHKAFDAKKVAKRLRGMADKADDEMAKALVALADEMDGSEEDDEMKKEAPPEPESPEIDLGALAEEVVSRLDVDLEPITKALDILASRMDNYDQAEKQRNANKTRMVLSLNKRASEADETALDESNEADAELLKAGPKETVSDNLSGSRHFFPTRK